MQRRFAPSDLPPYPTRSAVASSDRSPADPFATVTRLRTLPWALLVALLPAPALAQQSNWAAYVPGTLQEVVWEESQGLDFTPNSAPRGHINLSSNNHPQRVTVVHTGERRPLSDGARRVIETWGKAMANDSTIVRRFTNEYRFVENGNPFWIPIQTTLEEALAKEIRAGGRVTLLTRWLGTFHTTGRPQWVFIINEFEEPLPDFPPSQIELNGFLLGQEQGAIDSALGAPYQVFKGSKGVANRVYIIDREIGSYIVFSVDSSLGRTVTGIQVTGPKGTTARPFLGVALGDPARPVLARFGDPTSADPIGDIPGDLLIWTGRNYTLEVDTAGNISSIRVSGDQGLRYEPGDTETPSLPRLQAALRPMNVDSIVPLVAGDLRFIRAERIITFTGAARVELEDAKSAVRVHLKEVAERLRKAPDRTVYGGSMTGQLTWHATWQSGPIAELVFKWCAGGFRLWEVKYR